nr:pyruvate, water dikinase regulatory protein [Acetonema longum]
MNITLQNIPVIYILSDSVGETGEVVVKAAASQFDSGKVDIRRVPYLRSSVEVEDAVLEAAEAKAAIVYTLVRPDLCQSLIHKADELGVPCVDVMGPVLDVLKRITHTVPKAEPGLMRKLDEAYFSRLEAIDFAVKYDDGKQTNGLVKADIIIIGVSRTSKTPLSMYLATRGFKTANIPLVPEVSPPEDLFKLPSSKIFGLTIQPSLLLEIRQERLKTMGLPTGSDYANPERILEELDYSTRIMRKLGCPIIEVTNRAIEETAARIEEIFRKGANRI